MDGISTTKDRLLRAASRFFAEKGFRDATVAEICQAANANISAVNYHFGDKENLYDAVWRHAFDMTAAAYPIDAGLPNEPTIGDYLYSYANALLHRIFDETENGVFARLLYHEMASPTLALDRIASEVLAPQNEFLFHAVRTSLGESIDEERLRFCIYSIIGQCAFYNFGRPLRERVLGCNAMDEAHIERIARHIANFSLGGLSEIQKS